MVRWKASDATRRRADREDKLTIVTKDGFWSEKDEMSAAYAARATGDYLWQVDVDEFYLPEDFERIGNILQAQPEITAMSFNTITFWGAPGYRVEAWHHRRGAREYHRLFKWGEGYRYVGHRPPTVLDERGRDLRAGHWLKGADMERRGNQSLPLCLAAAQAGAGEIRVLSWRGLGAASGGRRMGGRSLFWAEAALSPA